jgi:hypothetical protein
MRLVILLLVGAGAFLGCASAPAPPTAVARTTAALPNDSIAVVQRPALRYELLTMAQVDQEARAPLMTAFQPGEQPDSAAMAAIVERIVSTDAGNLARLREIVREHGWPGRTLVGSDGVGAVFLLVQHADRDVAFQKEYLSWLERAFRTGEVSPQAGEALALLTDRVRTNEGRPQLYGTQVLIQDGGVIVQPIEDERNVDVRRAELGLPPLAEYLKQLRQFYGVPQ